MIGETSTSFIGGTVEGNLIIIREKVQKSNDLFLIWLPPHLHWLSAIFKSIFSFLVSLYRTEVVVALGAIYQKLDLKEFVFIHLKNKFSEY